MGKEAERREAAPVPVAAGFHQSSGAESSPPVAAMNMNLFIQLRQMGSHSAGGDVEHSRMLFALLDTDGSGDLTPSEFDKLPALEEKLKKQAKQKERQGLGELQQQKAQAEEQERQRLEQRRQERESQQLRKMQKQKAQEKEQRRQKRQQLSELREQREKAKRAREEEEE
eukprot:COSAG01_NODE_1309_length_10793_cov_10.360483_12_plen_169_part_01